MSRQRDTQHRVIRCFLDGVRIVHAHAPTLDEARTKAGWVAGSCDWVEIETRTATPWALVDQFEPVRPATR